MFFEIYNGIRGKGEIGYAVSENGLKWRYQKIVLEEAFHLSFPYVFKHENQFFMIPESYQAKEVRLYRADDFPNRWTYVCSLVMGHEFVDSGLLHDQGKFSGLTTFSRSASSVSGDPEC